MLTRYPGRFTVDEINAAENLRGIPKSINNWARLSAIRKAWDAFYEAKPDATREEIEQFRDLLDSRWGGNFVPYR